jgi:hypothetical protein
MVGSGCDGLVMRDLGQQGIMAAVKDEDHRTFVPA